MQISAVVNTYNEERNIMRCLTSIRPHVDEIVVVDMNSTDRTVNKAKQITDKVYKHPYTGYVEPARNFALTKAKNDWVLLLDADEELPQSLGIQIRRLVEKEYSFYRIPRKNLVFNKWLHHSGWWPDYQIRLFKKDAVSWSDEIHSIPITEGKGSDLLAEEANALIHYNYQTIEQFIERMNRYTSIEAQAKQAIGKQFSWRNLFSLPTNEFLNRYFAWEGYKDGLHGLILSTFQAISFFIVETKLWQIEQFYEPDEDWLQAVETEKNKINDDITHWFHVKKNEKFQGPIKKIYSLKSKFRL